MCPLSMTIMLRCPRVIAAMPAAPLLNTYAAGNSHFGSFCPRRLRMASVSSRSITCSSLGFVMSQSGTVVGLFV